MNTLNRCLREYVLQEDDRYKFPDKCFSEPYAQSLLSLHLLCCQGLLIIFYM